MWSDFLHFDTWCNSAGCAALPATADAVAAYLGSLADAGLKASTITRRCAAIAYAHRFQGFDPPTAADPVRAVLRRIRRRIAAAIERKAPLTAPTVADLAAFTLGSSNGGTVQLARQLRHRSRTFSMLSCFPFDRTDARRDCQAPPLSARDFAIARHLMIAVESSNWQQICKRLRRPFTNKLRSAGSGC
jgi:hypothetical protein